MLNSALRAAAAACALAVTATSAAAASEMVIERVGYSDLDLSSEGGRAKLESRIRWAATRVCSDYERPAPTGLSVNSQCFREAMNDARQKMYRAIAGHGPTRGTAVKETARLEY